MSEIFTRTFHIGWADVDVNAHMKNTAYMEKAIDVRLLYFDEQGFPMREFERLRLGPVVRRDEIEYFHELRLLEQVTISLTLAGISEDVSRFRLRSEFFRPDGKRAAKLSTTGGWLNLTARKLALPPPERAAALHRLNRSEDFEPLPSSIRSG
jgi:acyl-CoA thioester hydrolase